MTLNKAQFELQKLNEEQLNQDVAIWNDLLDEYYQLDVGLVFVDNTQDVLDVNHPVIRF